MTSFLATAPLFHPVMEYGLWNTKSTSDKNEPRSMLSSKKDKIKELSLFNLHPDEMYMPSKTATKPYTCIKELKSVYVWRISKRFLHNTKWPNLATWKLNSLTGKRGGGWIERNKKDQSINSSTRLLLNGTPSNPTLVNFNPTNKMIATQMRDYNFQNYIWWCYTKNTNTRN